MEGDVGMDLMVSMTSPLFESLKAKGRNKLADMYRRCFANTWDTTLQRQDGTVFLVTGDIPAMWLRDSSAQVFHYLKYADKYPEIADTIALLLRRQFMYINLDPYANAFNKEANDNKLSVDRTNWTPKQRKWIWERKYEVDSLCYPIRLGYAYYKKTGDIAPFDTDFIHAVKTVISVWKTEQRHMELSPYYFERTMCPESDTLPNHGKGNAVSYTGMTWSGFRPSDDACTYGYLIPANLFALRSLEQAGELVHISAPDIRLEEEIKALADDIRKGLENHAVVDTKEYGKVYAYETDGNGNYLLMDDANVPSLLSLPYLGCVSADDPVYVNTRKMILSSGNPYYYSGSSLQGIGSPHTPKGHVWPISLCIQGLTSSDGHEIRTIANMLESTDAETGYMHESIYKDDPMVFTRSWFAWANSIFSEFMEHAERYL